LHKERQEGNEKHEEDTEDTVLNPVKDGIKIIASPLSANEVPSSSVFAYLHL
jgi:hypothetical protein